MTDPIVVIEPDNVIVQVDTNTPVTTITDNTTGSIAVVNASPIEAKIVDERPTVIVRTGSGGSMDLTSIMTLLTGRLTVDHMDPNLYDSLTMLKDLWGRVTQDLLLTYPDGVAIQEAGQTFTNESISTAVNTINVSTDGKIDANTSLINQTSSAIISSVNELKSDNEDNFSVHDSRITQTAQEIASTVLALEVTDGVASVLRSDITQQAGRISLGVTRQDETDEDVIEIGSRVTITEDLINLAVTDVDSVTGRMDTAEETITANAITQSVSSEYLEQTLTSVQTILDNQWGVTVEEDINGNAYVAGFTLLLHPEWALGADYDIDDTVYSTDIYDVSTAYICIQANTGDISNSPTNSLYWTEIPGGAKSSFTVSAEEFKISGPNGLESVFVVDGVTGEITINGLLTVGALESVNYGIAGESWFKLDPSSGSAEFNNMTMTFSDTEDMDAVRTSLGITSVIYQWTGLEILDITSVEATADEWPRLDGAGEIAAFGNGEIGGCLIQITVEDDFDGSLDVVLNGEPLTLKVWDSGSIEDSVTKVIDCEQLGSTIDSPSIS